MESSGDAIPREVWRVAIVVVLGSLGSMLATTSVNVAIGVLSEELDAKVDTVQWIVSGYMLGLAATISTTGWLVRRFGARRLYLASLALFAVASALCAVAPTVQWLILFRVVQGVAGGATMPVGMMMLATAAGSDQMGRVMSVVGVAMILGPIAGPTLGGVVIDSLSWHWLFLTNVPLSLSALVLGWRQLPHMPARPAGVFDARGFALLVIGAPLLVYGLARCGATTEPLDSGGLGAIIVGVGLIAAFAVHALHTEWPLLDVRLWRNPGFAACCLSAMIVSCALFGMMVILPLSFQAMRDVSATTAGLLLVPHGIGAATGVAVAGRWADRVGGGRVAVVGITLLALATVPLLFITPTTPTWLVCAVLLVRGWGMSGAIMPTMAAAYKHLHKEDIPDATPQLNVLQRLGGAIGATVLTLALTSMLPAADATPQQVTAAFHYAFAWALGFAVLALAPACALARFDRVGRRPDDTRPLTEPDGAVVAA